MAERRKDSKGRVLKDGESERKGGGYQFRYPQFGGKRGYLYAKTLDELRKKEEELRKDQYRGIRIDKRNLTLNDLFEVWKSSKTEIRESTLNRYVYFYNLCVRDTLGTYKVKDISRSVAVSFLNMLKGRGGMCSGYISIILSLVKQPLNVALKDGYIASNPFSGLSCSSPEDSFSVKPSEKALSLKQQTQFFEYLANYNEVHKEVYPFFLFMVWTGLRLGEAAGLAWSDIDFDRGKLEVKRTLKYESIGNSKGRLFMNPPKTKASARTVPLLDEAKEALVMEKRYQDALGIKCAVPIDGISDLVFLRADGRVFNAGFADRVLKQVIPNFNKDAPNIFGEDAEQLPHFSTHMFRHTFATRLVENNVNIKAAQEWLGHSSVHMTMDVYAAATKEFQQDQAIAFGQNVHNAISGMKSSALKGNSE